VNIPKVLGTKKRIIALSKLLSFTIILPILMATVVGCTASRLESSILTVIRGEEDTSSLIHLVAIDVRGQAGNFMYGPIQGRIDEIYDQGGLAIVAHPDNDEQLKELKRYTGIELPADVGNALTTWDMILSEKILNDEPLPWGFTTDDAHAIEQFGKRFIVVRAPQLNKNSLISAIKDGSFYWGNASLIEDIYLSGMTITVILNTQAKISFFKQGGQLLQEAVGTSAQYYISGSEGYVRAEITSSDGKRAGTQPFRIKDASNIDNPYSIRGKWFKGNLHCHSTESDDGELSPEEVMTWYENNGYSFFSLTDHVRWFLPGEQFWLNRFSIHPTVVSGRDRLLPLTEEGRLDETGSIKFQVRDHILEHWPGFS
jgi:hypothetical protein